MSDSLNTLNRSSRAYFYYYVASQAVFDRGIFILFLLDRGFNGTEVGLLQSILFASAFLCEIPTGLLGDKYGRKKSVMLGLLIFIGYCFGVISFTGMAVFVTFYALYGLAMSLVSGSDRSLIYDIFKQQGEEHLFIRLESRSRAVGAAVLGVAIILGGVLQSISWDAVYIAYAGSLLVSLLAICWLPESKTGNEDHEQDFSVAKAAGRYFVVGEGRQQLPIILFMSMLCFAFFPFYIFAQSAFQDQGMSVEAVAWVFAIAQFVTSAGYFASDKIPAHYRLKVAFFICPLACSVLYLVIPLGGLYFMLAVFLLLCFVDTLIEPIYISHINQRFDSKIRAFSNSFDSFVQTLFIALGFYLYGELTSRYGFALVVQCSAVLPLIAMWLAWRYTKANCA